MLRALAPLILLVLLTGCPPRPEPRDSTAPPAPGAAPANAWLDPQARLSREVRLRGPQNIDMRQGSYWQPAGGELGALIRTRDYSSRDVVLDLQRVAVVDFTDGTTSRLDAEYAGLPIQFAVSPDHVRAAVAWFPDDEEGKAQTAVVALRCYGYGEQPVEILPQPAVLPVRIGDDGVYCRLVSSLSIVRGMPAPNYNWAEPVQIADVSAKTFSSAESGAIWPAPEGTGRAGYLVSYDPALPAKARITYQLSHGRSDRRWELPFYVSPSSHEWHPPLVWPMADTFAAVTYRPGAMPNGTQSADLFRIVAFSTDGARLIEDRVDPGVSLLAAPGVVFYARRAGGDPPQWEVWAAAPDGLAKQRIWHSEDSIFVELLDIHGERRLLLHRQFFDIGQTLRSELFELSLDRLTPTEGSVEPEALPVPEGLIEDEPEAEPRQVLPDPEEDEDDLGDPIFIPDRPLPPSDNLFPGDGPPPIAPT